MSRRLLLLTLLAAGCGRATAPVRPMIAASSETQLTTAPHGHILTNTAVWSPDSQWIVYDVRSDPAGSVFDGTRIERVNVRTKQIEVLYESKNGACVGVATVNPVDGRVVFIHGPENPTPDWSYSPCHREGVIVDPKKPGVAIPLEARDIVPPFTFGALRGGTHLHTWDETGEEIAFTYEDHLLTHGTNPKKEPNRRTVGYARPASELIQPKHPHPRNRPGNYYSRIIVETAGFPNPGTTEISRAFEEAWIPSGGHRFEAPPLTMIGEMMTADGRKVNELFCLVWAGMQCKPDPRGLNQSELTMPTYIEHPYAKVQITHFAEVSNHSGISTMPRHWPRSNSKGTKVALLTENGKLNILNYSGHFVFYHLEKFDLAVFPITLSSAFTWHPNSRHLAAIVDKCVCVIHTDTGDVKPLTPPSDPPPRPEACVVSPDGTMIAFVRPVNGFNQIFIVDVPAEAVK